MRRLRRRLHQPPAWLPFRYAIIPSFSNEAGRRFFDAEFVLGVEPRVGGRVDKPMFSIDCDGEDSASSLCKEFGPKAVIHGTLSSRSSGDFRSRRRRRLDIVTTR